MYFLLSPAKNLDENHQISLNLSEYYSQPNLIQYSQQIMSKLKQYDNIELQELMNISDKIAQLNTVRHQHWSYPFNHNAKPAIYLFNGDVYQGLDADSLNKNEMLYLNHHMGILSGLYGLLKPLDLILAYRLEMGIKLKINQKDNLYQFWDNHITNLINQILKENNFNTLINLASEEYFKVVNKQKIHADIITPKFLDYKNGQYKIISFYAKKARGMMARFIAQNQLENPEDLKAFNQDGYYFSASQSDKNTWVFLRNELSSI
ncbi:MAG: peroxide stress protein YaaA [Moraxella sp.]